MVTIDDCRARGATGLTTVWREAGRLFGGPAGLLIGFAVLHYACVWLGYYLKDSPAHLSWIWPASGSLAVTLWLAPARLWPAIILIQWGVEASFASYLTHPFTFGWSGWFLLANTLQGVATASVVRLLARDQYEVTLRKVMIILFGTGLGAAASGFLGAYAAIGTMGHESFIRAWQTWWAGNWLGVLAVAPVIYGWLVPLRRVFTSLHQRNRWEALLHLLVLAPLTWWMFSLQPGEHGSILQLPEFLIAFLVIAALRLPPRWSVTIASVTTLIAVHQTAHGLGPYVVGGPFDVAIWGQFRLMLMIVITLMVASFTAERAMATELLEASEKRYRDFIELTSEAVARIELARALPVNLPREQLHEWFWQHARIAESNGAFARLGLGPLPGKAGGPTPGENEAWTPLVARFLERLAVAADPRCEGLRLDVPGSPGSRSHSVSFEGVVSDGHLQRVWCIANDITEIVDLNSRLLRDQERIKSYARQIMSADERARRATAVDLHDGIAQSLVAMEMMLKVLRDRPESGTGLIDELSSNVRSVQEKTRTMIADLSPPGLYDLGLVPALQWLAVRFRSHDRLHVQLECSVEEQNLPKELRILIFKLIRELLRNVVKHAGVDRAAVMVYEDDGCLHVEVRDSGVGFLWQLDLFGQRAQGFGLWSIAERVSEIGGELSVDSAPGRGARFAMSFPLERAAFRIAPAA